MQYTKKTYLTGNKYYASVRYDSADQHDLDLFVKYAEPEVNIGGTFDNGTTTFSLPDSNKKIKSDSPFISIFDTVSGGYDYTEAGKRASLYVDTIVSRIDTLMTNLRNTDSTTNTELIKTIVL